jgi:hypothetical protein
MAIKVKYDAVVICEQVRPEQNGKAILIGVMHSFLAMPSFPTKMFISVYAEGNVLEAGEFSGATRVEDEEGNVLFQREPETPLTFVPGRFGQMMQLSIPIERPSVIKIFFNVGGEDHLLVSRPAVLQSPVPTFPVPEELIKG